jgi:hypothetical protein
MIIMMIVSPSSSSAADAVTARCKDNNHKNYNNNTNNTESLIGLTSILVIPKWMIQFLVQSHGIKKYLNQLVKVCITYIIVLIVR